MSNDPSLNAYSEYRNKPFYIILPLLSASADSEMLDDDSVEISSPSPPLKQNSSPRCPRVIDDKSRKKKPFDLEEEFEGREPHCFYHFISSDSPCATYEDLGILYSVAEKRIPEDSRFWSVINFIYDVLSDYG